MTKYDVLKMMHEMVITMGDELCYEAWINIIPDGADDDDLYEIAHDEELYNDACDIFVNIMKTYIM